MNYEQAYQKLQQFGQEHILKYYEELTETEQIALLEQIAKTDFSDLAQCGTKLEVLERGKIAPIRVMQIPEITSKEEAFTKRGVQALQEGKIGAVLLAGGMGTRLGSDDPKGMYDIGLTKPLYIFECLVNNMMQVVRQTGAWIPLYIMTSEKNEESTRNFLEEKEFFGYNKDYVSFFVQEMAPASDYNGKAYMEEKGRIATSPNGNGGWFSSMERCGILDKVHETGVEYLNVFAVDNVLQKIADPCFIGAVLEEEVAVGAKVIRKNAPDERVGVMCLEDGKPSIIEYYELTEELVNTKDENGERVYNFGVILNYLFRVKDLEEIAAKQLPLHMVEKKINYLDENGNLVKPEEPNGYKYENLILDMIQMLETCLPYEIVREKEFAPIKNKTGIDSVESARELLKLNQVEL